MALRRPSPHLIEQVTVASPKLALTFDDGPSEANTGSILDLLARYRARATFFVVGKEIDGREQLLERIVRESHEVGNHTFGHAHTVALTGSELLRDLAETNAAVARLANVTPAVGRPPYGKDRRRFARVAASLGMTTALWTLDSGDTKGWPGQVIAEHLLACIQPGAILLFHDGGGERPETRAALDELLPSLVDRSYELVTVSELLAAASTGPEASVTFLG
jgi:peptidoglycan/xylan/chitin deacetylase (PgdA/CDA1 family)